MRVRRFQHRFVGEVPRQLEAAVLYVCIEFCTAVHLCACGCGSEVVTPLSRTDWSITFDGDSVSLNPSIGNWGFACRSHYFIRRGWVRWARLWTDEEVEAGRAFDRWNKSRYFEEPEDQALLATPRDLSDG